MDLSTGLNLHELKFIKTRSGTVSPRPGQIIDCENDVLDLGKIQFEDDESWLYQSSNVVNYVENLQSWLHNDFDYFNNDDLLTHSIQLSTAQNVPKNIDSRTFTRPKKRFTRPSIEKYNEEVYGSNFNKNGNLTKDCIGNGALSTSFIIQEDSEPTTSIKPLHFDLSQPSNSFYFDNMVANIGESDSFQNMSPPSLVNSMCSSTFANLMESSFIKNDPVLREIRDTDFTETVLLQDSEPPMFQSITESCSSLNSDSPESFLRKVSRSDTFKKRTSADLDKTITLNSYVIDLDEENSYGNHKDSSMSHENDLKLEKEEKSSTFANLNGTYRRSPWSTNTFRRSDRKNNVNLNDTFYIAPDEISDQGSDSNTLTHQSSIKSLDSVKALETKSLIRENTIEDMKKGMSDTMQITDLNRLSYCLEDNIRLDSSYNEEHNDFNKTLNIKRSSVSTGSADSLDRMSSSLSSSSRGSNRMLNMADVDAIVEMQEKSLRIMSTPKVITGPKKIWDNNFISPIVTSGTLSDSDVSSNEEYKSVRSSVSKTSLENYGTSKSAKSLGYLGGPIDTKIKATYRSTNNLNTQKPLQANPNHMRSYSNLKTLQSNIPGSQGNLCRPSFMKAPSSTSNLKSMGPKLKGSYTSLKPISANLPIVPPINTNLNSTKILSKATNPNVTQNIDSHMKIVEVPPMPRDKSNIIQDMTFVKPQPRSSGLPRPTGIPRPASKIPGPRSATIRPLSSKSIPSRPDVKDGFH